MDFHPKTLRIAVGGYTGPSYSVELCDGKLRYEAREYGYANPRSESIAPTEEQWAQFRSALDSGRVWQWQPDYPNPGAVDGTQWSIEVAYEDATVLSHGDNSYPKANGKPSGNPDGTREFNRLMRAVRALLGGRRFE
jgi:hypothetical protein